MQRYLHRCINDIPYYDQEAIGMKEKVIVSALVLMLLAGCSSDTKDLRKEVDTLKGKVVQLEKKATVDEQNEKTNETGNTESLTKIKDKINSFKTSSETLVKKMDGTATSKNREDSINTYVEFKKEVNTLEREMDTYDKRLEALYHAKKLSFDDYRKYEKQLDRLDEPMNQAEDDLALRLGIDDEKQ